MRALMLWIAICSKIGRGALRDQSRRGSVRGSFSVVATGLHFVSRFVSSFLSAYPGSRACRRCEDVIHARWACLSWNGGGQMGGGRDTRCLVVRIWMSPCLCGSTGMPGTGPRLVLGVQGWVASAPGGWRSGKIAISKTGRMASTSGKSAAFCYER